MPVIVIAILSQLLFTSSDLLGRYYMKHHGFTLANFVSWWFFLYVLIRTIGTFGQLYIFSSTEVGKTMTYFAALSLILINLAGILFLGEVLTLKAYLGIALAIAAILIIGLSK